MGRRKKSSNKKSAASSVKSFRTTSESSACVSDDTKDKNMKLEQDLANCQLTEKAEGWETYKAQGNSLFMDRKFEASLKLYTLAIEALEADTNAKDFGEELAKLYGNRSISYQKLSAACAETSQQHDLCSKALADGERAVQLDKHYEKGYYRCVSSLLSLGRKGEAIKYLTEILGLSTSTGKDKYLKDLLTECKYMSATKTESPHWEKVKFKENCLVLDPDGTGDVTTLSSEMIRKHKKLSILVKPGTYCCGGILVTKDQELNIVGDVGCDGSPKEVVFMCQGSAFDRNVAHIFAAIGGKLSLENVSIRQESRHPEIHGIFVFSYGFVTVRNCEGYSHSSGWIAVSHSSYLDMSNSTIDGACGGVIVVEGSSAVIDGCFIKNCDKIGVEGRSGGTILLVNSEISTCGSQGLVVHAEAKSCMVERCVFYGNSRKLQNQPDVLISRSAGVIRDTQVTSIRGTCVMVQEGGRLKLERCNLAGGNACIGLILNGNAMVNNCKMANCNIGVAITMNRPGQVVMKNNEIKSRLSEIGISCDDDPPLILEGRKHTIQNLGKDQNFGKFAKGHLEREKEVLEKDHFVDGMQWDDPRNLPLSIQRFCSPCGLSQSSVGHEFFPCSGCKLNWYCSKKCQNKDSVYHQPMCQKTQEIWKSN